MTNMYINGGDIAGKTIPKLMLSKTNPAKMFPEKKARKMFGMERSDYVNLDYLSISRNFGHHLLLFR